MTNVVFKNSDGALNGFTLSGHAGAGDAGYDIVCSAISSAAYMTANMLTEIFNEELTADVRDGFMSIALSDGASPVASDILKGFKLHMEQLCGQYPDFIKITTEV